MLRLSAALVWLVSSSAFASTADTRELLEGEQAMDFVAIVLKEQPLALEYWTHGAGDPRVSHPLNQSKTLLVGPNVKVLLEFVNPVTHTWSTSEEVKDDPTFVALKAFAAAVNGYVGMLGDGSPAKASVLALNRAPAATPRSDLNVVAPDLVELAMWLQQSGYADCIANKAYERAVNASDADFYVATDSARAASVWRTKSLSPLRGVVDATSASQFKQAHEALTAAIDDLTALNATAKERLRVVEQGKQGFIDGKKTGCEAFAVYATVALSGYIATAARLLDARSQMVADLTAIKEQSNKQPIVDSKGKSYFEVASVASEVASMKLVSFTLKRREVKLPNDPELGGRVSIDDKESVSAVLKFRRYQSLVVEFAPGFALVFGDQPRVFGTATVGGTTVVTSTAAEKLGILATLMANFIPRLWNSSTVWLIGQVGVGVGKPSAMLLTGLGLRFAWLDLSLTGGAAFTFPNIPLTLRPGDVVPDATALENDLRPHFAVSPYLGFQKSF